MYLRPRLAAELVHKLVAEPDPRHGYVYNIIRFHFYAEARDQPRKGRTLETSWKISSALPFLENDGFKEPTWFIMS